MTSINHVLRTEVRSIPGSIWAIAIIGLLMAITFLLGVMICGCCDKGEGTQKRRKKEEPVKNTTKSLMEQSGRSAGTTRTEYSTHISMISNFNATGGSSMLEQKPEVHAAPKLPQSTTSTTMKAMPELQLMSLRRSPETSMSCGKASPALVALDDQPSLRMMSIRRPDTTKVDRTPSPPMSKTTESTAKTRSPPASENVSKTVKIEDE